MANPSVVDFDALSKTLATAEKRLSIVGARCAYPAIAALVKALSDSGLTSVEFAERLNAVEGRPAPRKPKYFSCARAAIKAYPSAPETPDDCADFVAILYGNANRAARAAAPKASPTVADYTRRACEEASKAIRAGGDRDTIAAAITAAMDAATRDMVA
jgi:hypothetical protein